MAYDVYWRIPDQILCLELAGNLTLDDFTQINQVVIEHLGEVDITRRIALLIDVTQPGTIPASVSQLKVSQTYVLRNDLKFILVVGKNKLSRLMMLLIFNLCRQNLVFFNEIDESIRFLQKTGIRVGE